MIRCRLLELMGRRGVRFLSRVSRETGINRRTLAVLADNKMARYDADVLDRLCVYFRCQPGELLEHFLDAAPIAARPVRRALCRTPRAAHVARP